MKTYTIQALLNEWGQAQRKAPINNTALKNHIIGNFSTHAANADMPKRNFRLPWFSLLLSGVALFMLFTMPGKPNFENFQQTSVSNESNAGLQKNTTALSTKPQDSSLDIAPDYFPTDRIAQQQQPNAGSAMGNVSGTPLPTQSNLTVERPMPMPTQGGLKIPDGDAKKNIDLPAFRQTSLKESQAKILPYQPNSEVPSSDNREFLKTIYSAGIFTHNVTDFAGRIQTVIRGFGGRIDSGDTASKYAYISFVIPASKFEAFRQEIKSLAGERFYKENVRTENMLPQKKGIEEQQKNINTTLDQLNAQKTQFTKDHNAAASSIQSQINYYSKQLADLKNQKPDNLQQYLNLESQKVTVSNAISTLRGRLAQENNSYSNQLDSLNIEIQNYQTSYQQTKQENNDLLDTVDTVHGSIVLNWINIWAIINLYIPVYWIALALIIVAIATYFFRRRAVITLP